MQLNEDITNFMETLVEEEFERQNISTQFDNDYVQDLFCLTLNQLSPHYVRNTIDVRINITPAQRQDIAQKVISAMHEGHKVLGSHRRSAQARD
ncbi:late competence development ComFB family protein [Zhongshania arctica]|uniref:Late competence development ComFB family protein n=1 Tax=Zhongshania arctica TaxID=3238302 RepID=A0ABV3TWM3_9GAMM|tara:strand:- start:18661 stop:18942 length:282 start_codon:yes stop_codon:yes gene_type:complete